LRIDYICVNAECKNFSAEITENQQLFFTYAAQILKSCFYLESDPANMLKTGNGKEENHISAS
jgi:hypothetical protein